MDKNRNTLSPEFKGQSLKKNKDKRQWTNSDGTNKSYDFFGLEKSNRFVRRFKLILRDGRMISIPYAYLPVIVYDPNDDLKIKTGDIEITISGRGLNTLADFLNEEKVMWMKESASGVDEQDSAVFISSIIVDGDLVL